MLSPTAATGHDRVELIEFLRLADLTLSGLDSPAVSLWIVRDPGTGRVFASTGFELSANGEHALIRSVAVHPDRRAAGLGLELAAFALRRAAEAGARRAWLFSRRSGPFWQKVGFAPAVITDLAAALASTHQVRLFTETGQLDREVAWSRALDNAEPPDPVVGTQPSGT